MPDESVTFLIPPDLAAQVDAVRAKLQDESPRVRLTRSDALRAALERGCREMLRARKGGA